MTGGGEGPDTRAGHPSISGPRGKADAEMKRLTPRSGVVSWRPWTLVVERDGFALDEQGIR